MSDFILTKERWFKLRRLWFIYGNNGKKHTHSNHRFIQDLVEVAAIDSNVQKQFEEDQEFFSKELTLDCIREVREILTS